MLNDDALRFRDRLRNFGFSDSAINAAWPSWWSEDADDSQSARAELRYSVARKLGLDPRSLLEDKEAPRFVWKDAARFKHLSGETEVEKWALTSFGISVGRLLVLGTPPRKAFDHVSAAELRSAILAKQKYVRLVDLLSISWGMGIPVAHLQVFPFPRKRMVGMSVQTGNGNAILLGKDSTFPPQIAFYLAHELGHIMLGHLRETSVMVDMEFEDTDATSAVDPEETAADMFALELLTGHADISVFSSSDATGSKQLAKKALQLAEELRIEPGTLAMCFGFSTQMWPVAFGALKYIYETAKPVWREINRVAREQLSFSNLPDDSQLYLKKVLGELE